MPVTHEPWLVALSLIAAIQGSYVGLSLAVQVRSTTGTRRRLLLAGSAISLAIAIWSMHFVGILAARMPLPVDYLVFPTLLSFLVCVIVVGIAIFATSVGPLTTSRLLAGALFMGCGIASMHYIGMLALHASAIMEHSPPFVAASVAIAIAASGLALWLAEGHVGRPPLFLSAIVLGLAISGMHYTAMAGLTLYFPHDQTIPTAPAISSDLLAIVVAIVGFLVSGVFLLTLVPDRTAPAVSEAETEPTPPAAVSFGNALDAGQGTFSPLKGAGGPPVRHARHLPVEREGATHYIPVSEVVAVHANAHYTFIFDGTHKWFSPLAIGDVESRLNPEFFVRVHRSHIVNIERVAGLKRTGDAGLVELAAAQPYTVPISRSRIAPLKSRLKLRASAVA